MIKNYKPTNIQYKIVIFLIVKRYLMLLYIEYMNKCSYIEELIGGKHK